MSDEFNSRAGAGRLFRWRRCRCPRCGGEHLDLVSWDERPAPGLVPQVCDICFTSKLTPQAREAYYRWRQSVAPPREAAEPQAAPRPAAQAPLPFGDGGDAPPRPKGPPGPWERYLQAAKGGA
jgi:hypothetical protein